MTFLPVPLRGERKLSSESVGYFTYLHWVYSPEFFPVASGRKSTRKLFRQATELMVTIEQEFVANSTTPPFALISYPFLRGISLPFGAHVVQKTQFFIVRKR